MINKHNEQRLESLRFIGYGLNIFFTICIVITMTFVTSFVINKAEAMDKSFDLGVHQEKELSFGSMLEKYFSKNSNPYYGEHHDEYKTIYDWVAEKENGYLFRASGNPITCAYEDVWIADANHIDGGYWIYSIGYGSVADGKDECITKQEAWDRFKGVFKSLLYRIGMTFPDWRDGQVESFASFTFNVRSEHSNTVRNRFLDGDDVGAIYYWESIYMKGTPFEPGLKPRRQEEVDISLNY